MASESQPAPGAPLGSVEGLVRALPEARPRPESRDLPRWSRLTTWPTIS